MEISKSIYRKKRVKLRKDKPGMNLKCNLFNIFLKGSHLFYSIDWCMINFNIIICYFNLKIFNFTLHPHSWISKWWLKSKNELLKLETFRIIFFMDIFLYVCHDYCWKTFFSHQKKLFSCFLLLKFFFSQS